MSRNIAEWREFRGFSREDLATKLDLPVEVIERWERVGLDVKPGTRYGDFMLSKLSEALDAGEGLSVEYVPSGPGVGDLVIKPVPEADALIEALFERAGELDLRMCVPDEWGHTLRPAKELSETDQAAVNSYFDKEAAYSRAVAERLSNFLEMLGGNSGEWKEGQTAGERLEEVDRQIGAELDRRTGGAE
ncbi:helix-turn-helix domain-containing protein [Rubrobacter indicoceani]|uniref:helix-turn-helix domain-containing protein n=1 Tax=Rubrobacter indicoceani TaxID=2051957 RepID=UPI000E5C2614|nr:hypothetical protein [Rubrobacter indicoceani]